MGRKDSGGQRVPRTLLNSRYIKELKEIREISNISFFSIIPLNSISLNLVMCEYMGSD